MARILNQEASFSDYTYQGQSLSSFLDNQIVRLVLDGHEDAFAELYHRYSRDIYSYILRLVPNPSVADDLLQEIFVAVWQGLENFKSESSVKTWLFQIAHNKIMSWMRTYYRDRELVEEKARNLEKAPTTAEQTIINWQAEMVQMAIGELSPNHRAVVELFYFMGLSYAEISEVVVCPVGTVKSRMSHALQNLNGILTMYGLE